MAPEDNFFALLADEEGDVVLKLINRVKENKNLQKDKKGITKMGHPVPTHHMQAKRLVLPSYVRRSFIVFDKKKQREKAEAEANANDSVENNGATDNKSGNFSVSGYRGRNGYHGKNGCHYQRSYQRKNNNGHCQGSHKGSINGNHRYNLKSNGVSNGEQMNNGGECNGNADDDGWTYVGRRRHGNRMGACQHVISHGSLEEYSNSCKREYLRKSVNGDISFDLTEKKDVGGEQAVENKVEWDLHLTSFTEGQENVQSEKKKKKKKKKKKVTEEIVEKKDVKKENLMTLEEYEKKVVEDRKSLEALKRPERGKVEDKDFESMQRIGKLKEERELKSDQDKLKKKDIIKEKKAYKTVSISEFLKPAEDKRQNENGERASISKGNGSRPSNGQRPNSKAIFL